MSNPQRKCVENSLEISQVNFVYFWSLWKIKIFFFISRILEKYLKKSGKIEFYEDFRNYRKLKIQEDLNSCLPKNSKFLTFVHANLNPKNILINSQKNQVRFLNFEAMQLSHPASDFWSFIYSTTNAKWRKQHLNTCFQIYHEEVSKYHKYSTLLEFIEEFDFKRRYGISFSFLRLFLNNQEICTSLKKCKKLQKEKIQTLKRLGNAENSSVRQNIMEIIEEANHLKIMWLFHLPQKSSKTARNL